MKLTRKNKFDILKLRDEVGGRIGIARKLELPLHLINTVLRDYKNLKDFLEKEEKKNTIEIEFAEKVKLVYFKNKESIKKTCKELKIGSQKVSKNLKKLNIHPTLPGDQKIKKSKLGENVSRFFDKNTLHLAYVMGVILGDGCVHNNESTGKYYLNVTSEDMDILNSCNVYFENKHNVVKIKNVNAYKLNIWSKPLVDLLYAKYGLKGKKAHNLPWICFEENLCKAFISGLHATDGSIYELQSSNKKYDNKRIHWNYTTVCLSFLTKMKKTLEDFIPKLNKTKIKTRIHKNKNISYSISYSTQDTLKICNWMYSNTNELIRCNRKYSKYLEWKNYVFRKGKPISPADSADL